MRSGFDLGWAWPWWLLLLVGVAAMAVGLLQARRPGGAPGPAGDTAPRSTARQILDERFARGEIDQEEYRAIRKELDEH